MSRRGNAEGSLYRRRDGRWVAALTDPATGRQRYWYAKTRSVASAALNDALRRRDDNLQLAPSSQTLADYLVTWEQDVAKPTVRPSTFASYATVIHRHLIPDLGRYALRKLGPEHVQAMLRRKLDTGLSPCRVHYIRSVLRRALGDSVRWGLISRNAASLARGPKLTNSNITPMTREEISLFLQHVATDRLGRVWQMRAVVDDDRGECDTAEVGQCVLVVSGGDAAPLLEAVETAFDGVAVPVGVAIEVRWPSAV